MVTCKETRAAIVALHKNGFTGKDIVATKIAPKSTIYRFIENFKERGSILVKKASGRPRKSSKRQDRLLKRIQLRDRSATSAELAQEWQQAGVSASARTVRPRLLEDGLVSRRAAKKPLLSKKNIRDRLIFCRKYSEWTAEDWGKVIFSDEAPFRLFGASGKRLVWRRKGERYHQSCIPVTLHNLVSDKLASIIKGTDPDLITGTTYCRRLTRKDYMETVQKTTREELWTLLKTIHENTKLSLKEKRRLLGQFYRGHPEIFVQYFGNRISNVYI
ncbi:DEP domain-containing protein 7 [Anabarilius grahami]|uniref:DEP domain-containing protein 7 n=1 Tax=Anabarilius grahami TaxID=495550 RepID=A0A3N0Z307_ANAGA|nr:DEP domain-containing protein 7 [Anabarilius grahami]